MGKIENKEKFISLLSENVKRDGVDKLIGWLEKTDFFDAPASTKFHSAYEGGLCEHSLKVYDRFLKNIQNEYTENWQDKISLESITLIALLHDICKVDFYKVDYRNVKVDGIWQQQPFYVIEDNLPYGHGEKSVYIINGFIKLTREEAMVINWHMGAFDDRVKGGSYALSNVFYMYPTALIFNISDMQATYLDEER